MQCEWDEEKNRANQKKHDHAIGQVEFGEGRAALSVVVHVYRSEKKNGKEIIRIISAREADKRERETYRQKGLK